jgi:2'-5' RNA ligase
MEMIRSFVSISIPKMPVVGDTLEKLRGIRGVSVSKEAHITLRFLGDVETKNLKELSARMESLEAYPPFKISVREMGAFPNTKDPRVIWMGAEPGGPFRNILSDLDKMLDDSSIDFDKKPFKAHITIGRVKESSKDLVEFLKKEQNVDAGSFICSEILLMKSVITQTGAKHSVMAAFRLRGN